MAWLNNSKALAVFPDSACSTPCISNFLACFTASVSTPSSAKTNSNALEFVT